MIEEFVKQILKEPSYKTLSKAKLEIIDWIGYAIAGTFTEQAIPFYNLQKILPIGNCLNLFSKDQINLFDSAFINASVGNILELDDENVSLITERRRVSAKFERMLSSGHIYAYRVVDEKEIRS